MSSPRSSDWRPEVVDTLRALGGEGTLGDIVAITGLFRAEVIAALDKLMASERVHVRVSESGDVLYHLGPGVRRARRSARRQRSSRSGQVGFDRKTLRLIRAREGVLSLAELVEHTGLSLAEAEEEMGRLARSYGGSPESSLDGHVVWVFSELMTSSHGRFASREPRPAWVRAEDPMAPKRAHGPIGRLTRALGHFRRFRNPKELRRYALGYVVQTALAGKGVVSLERTLKYLRARAGRRWVSRSATEAALRALSAEFDAPVTVVNGELFFGFRNLKRQFLASQLVRRRLRLGRTASGRTVFDTADSPSRAAARDLESFDIELLGAVPGAEKRHDGVVPAE